MTSDFQLGPWLIQPSRSLVAREGREVRLEPRAMEVLCFLAARRGEVAPKREILDEVWSGTHVSDEALTYAISQIRKALGDDAKRPSFVENVPRKGYRLVAPLTFERKSDAERRAGRYKWLAAALAMAVIGGAWIVATRPDPAERSTLVVLPFDDHTLADDYHWLASGVPSMLVTDLAQSPGLHVLNVDVPDAGAARRAGAGAVIAGDIYQDGESLRIDARLQDAGGGRVLFAHSVSGESVFALVSELTGLIRADLGLDDARDGRALTEITTASLDAYRLYSQGLLASRNARWDDAWELFHQAIEVDPEFAMAYFELTKMHRPTHPFLRTEYRQAVLDRLDRLPERERLVVLATYEEDPHEAIRRYEELLERYPGEEDAYRSLSSHYVYALDAPDRGLDVMRRGLAELPDSGSLLNEYGYQLMDLGRHEEAIRAFIAYTEVSPEEPNPFDSLGQAYLLSCQLEEAHEALGRAIAIDPDFSNAYTARAWAYGMVGRYDEAIEQVETAEAVLPREGYEQMKLENRLMRAFLLSRMGRYREATEEIQRGLQLAGSLPHGSRVENFHLLAAMIDIERDALDLARERLATLRESFSSREPDDVTRLTSFFSGIVEARSGHPEEARGYLHTLAAEEVHALGVDLWRDALKGEIALAGNDVSLALEAFTAATPAEKVWFYATDVSSSLAANNLFVRDGLARAKIADGEREGAIAIYRELLSCGPDANWTSVLEPRYVLALARLLEANGQVDEAATEHGRFRELWKKADDGLAEVPESGRD